MSPSYSQGQVSKKKVFHPSHFLFQQPGASVPHGQVYPHCPAGRGACVSGDASTPIPHQSALPARRASSPWAGPGHITKVVCVGMSSAFSMLPWELFQEWSRNSFPPVNPWGFLQSGTASTETTSPCGSARDSAAMLGGRVMSGDRDNPTEHCLSAWSIFQTFW